RPLPYQGSALPLSYGSAGGGNTRGAAAWQAHPPLLASRCKPWSSATAKRATMQPITVFNTRAASNSPGLPLATETSSIISMTKAVRTPTPSASCCCCAGQHRKHDPDHEGGVARKDDRIGAGNGDAEHRAEKTVEHQLPARDEIHPQHENEGQHRPIGPRDAEAEAAPIGERDRQGDGEGENLALALARAQKGAKVPPARRG